MGHLAKGVSATAIDSLMGVLHKKARIAKEPPRLLKTRIVDRSLWLLNHAVKLPEIIHVKLHGFELLFSGKEVACLHPVYHVL